MSKQELERYDSRKVLFFIIIFIIFIVVVTVVEVAKSDAPISLAQDNSCDKDEINGRCRRMSGPQHRKESGAGRPPWCGRDV